MRRRDVLSKRLPIALVCVVGVWFAIGACSTHARMARWADRELAAQVEALEKHHELTGAYPLAIDTSRPVPDMDGFPERHSRFYGFRYAVLDLDDYVLAAVVDFQEHLIDPMGHSRESVALVTGARGRVRELPPHLGVDFISMRSRRLQGTSGRWGIWGPADPRRRGAEQGFHQFRAGLNNPDPVVRAAAAVAFGRSRDTRGIELLVDALADPVPSVRGAAAFGLTFIGDEEVLPALRAAASDPDPQVRRRAERATRLIALRTEPEARVVGYSRASDFENVDVGDFPFVDGWRRTARDVGAAVSEAVAHRGRKSLRLEGGADGRGGMFQKLPSIPDLISYRIAVLPSAAPGDEFVVGLCGPRDGGDRIHNGFRLRGKGGPSGTIGFQGALRESATEVGTFTGGEWVVLQADLDFSRSRAELWMNGSRVAADVPIHLRLPDSEDGRLDRLCVWGVYQAGSQRDSRVAAHVDDVALKAARDGSGLRNLVIGSRRFTAASVRFDFEEAVAGTWPSELGWTTVSRGRSAHVTRRVAHGGTQSLELEGLPGLARCEALHVPEMSNRVTFEASVLADPNPGRRLRVGFIERIGGVSRFYNRFQLRTLKDGEGAVLFRGALDAPALRLGQFDSTSWVTLKADLDFAEETADLWVNGVRVAVRVPIVPRNFTRVQGGPVVLTRWGVSTNRWTDGPPGSVFVDDVHLTGLTETHR